MNHLILEIVAVWLVQAFMGVPHHAAMVNFLMVVAISWSLLALVVDMRVLGVGLSFAGGAIATMFLPQIQIALFGMTTLVAFTLLARAWRVQAQAPAKP